MAQVAPLLSLCIPIYNRLAFLDRQLARFLEDKKLFDEKIELIISDNCSKDDLESCCNQYQKQELKLTYHRNETNLGPDGNFDWCFHHANGKYVWLLGSDDIPVQGFLSRLVEFLSGGDYGLVHINVHPHQETAKVYHNDNTILADIGVWMTFMSANVIRTSSLNTIDLKPYVGSYMIQVPAYLNGCLSSDVNAAVYLGKPFESGTDSANNGGYNLFQVFVENLFGIYQRFVDGGQLPQQTFEQIKRSEYKNWLVNFVVDFLILHRKKRKNFDLANSWLILYKHYGRYLYPYRITTVCLLKKILKSPLLKIRKIIPIPMTEACA